MSEIRAKWTANVSDRLVAADGLVAGDLEEDEEEEEEEDDIEQDEEEDTEDEDDGYSE